MTGLVDMIRSELDERCLVTRVRKRGCKVAMTDAPSPRLIVDFDKPGSPLPSPSARCDYLVVAQGEQAQDCVWVVPLELERGKLTAQKVVKQLQQGASAAEQFIPPHETVRFRPIAVSRRRTKHERNLLKRKSCTVRFHGHTEPVLLMSCGAALAKVLYS